MSKSGVETNRRLRREDLSSVRLGRRPFSTSLGYYEAFQEGRLSRSTLDVDMRKLKHFACFFEGLYDSGGCPTADPRHIDEATVNEFLIWMRSRGLKESTQETNVKILNRLLQLFGNDVVAEMRKKPWQYKLPKAPRDTPISALSRSDLQTVIDCSYGLGGWSGAVFRGMLALSFATAARPNETMSVMFGDLDVSGRRLYIRHPKGEGSWAVPQSVPIIREDMVPMIKEFLTERSCMMAETGISSEFLFVNPATGAPYSLKTMRALKGRVEELSGVHFTLKEMRSTFATLTVNNDLQRIDAVSAQLRHSSTDTTRRYYARINRVEAVRKDLGGTWKETEIIRRPHRPSDQGD